MKLPKERIAIVNSNRSKYRYFVKTPPHLICNACNALRWVFAYDSITVSSAWELISVSMCYSQGGIVNTPCLGLCTVPTSSVRLCSFVFVPGSLSCVSCDYLPSPEMKLIKIMCFTPTIQAGINCPPPSETISHVTRVPDYNNTLSENKGLLSVSDEGPCEKVYFYTRWRSRAKN